MLRTEVFDGLGAGTLDSDRTFQELVFRRNGDFEILAVAGHVEYGFSDYRDLSDHADVVGAGGQHKSFDFMILADDATVGGASGGFEFRDPVEGFEVAGESVVAVAELLLGGFERHRARGGWNRGGLGDR